MKRKAFILTEILTGMMLQALFALTLCGAFYLILTFSTSTQQILAAHDQGQMVISYIDNRIRNAGVGLHQCEDTSGKVSPEGVAKAFNIPTNMKILKDKDGLALPLPVAITSKTNGDEVISKDGRIYEGNILVLLHAHKDHKYQDQDNTEGDLVVLGFYPDSPDLPMNLSDSEQVFKFIKNVKNKDTNFIFTSTVSSTLQYKNIKSWAVMEASGVPVRVLRDSDSDNVQDFKMIARYTPATIYPMSELLNLECQKLYVMEDAPDNGGRSFVFSDIKDDGAGWDTPRYHTKGILELYMRLDTNPNPPIFDLKVLCSEGKSNEVTAKPNNWPAAYWKPEFAQHKVHVSQASWKLYNLAPLYHND